MDRRWQYYEITIFRNKIFEMNYADNNFYIRRHIITSENKNRNGRVYYGIQLSAIEECTNDKNAGDNLLLNNNNLQIRAFIEISDGLRILQCG
ncbi:hypothetical protein [Lacrimispora brassicae]